MIERAPTSRRGKRGRGTCAVEGCDDLVHGYGYCSKHYRRLRKHGDTETVHNRWSRGIGRAKVGARYYDRHSGYVRVYDPEHPHANARTGQVKEHIRVMAEHLGRPLAADETVHHRNGVRDDNRVANLELRVGAHPRGMTVPDAVEWARMILARYEG